MPELRGAPIWYELMTRDPAAAGRFYGAVVGWTLGEKVTDSLDYRMLIRGDGGNAGGVMALDSEMIAHGARPAWLGYIGVPDVDATIAQIEARGGTILMPAWDQPGVGRLAMATDPQGNPFYLMCPSMPEDGGESPSDVFSVDAEQRVGWNELSTPDPVAARGFYEELFGWTSDEFMPMGELGEYRFLAWNGTTIGAVCGVPPGGSQGWRYYIRVPSIARAVEAVNVGGGSVSMGPHEVPGGDHIIIGNDPDGAVFALVGKA